jgi:succinyl-diaminopimelate desuccinylase
MHEPSTPIDSIVDLTQRLVRIPSRAGVDSYEPILTLTRQWLEAAGVACEPLLAAGRLVGLHGVVRGGSHGPVYMLDATLDTAGFGDESHWRDAPTSGVIRNGRLHGRGAADSKAGAALFCHLLAAFARRADSFSGTLVLLLDLDEHTGGFAGVRTYFAREASLPRPQGVFIGYPGNERIVVGGRGFLRASLVVRGESAHSGSSRPCGINAVVRAAALSQQLAALALPAETDSRFPLPPKLTVTAIEGGQGDSLVPDRCSLRIDVRLTPRFDDHAAREAVSSLVATFDAQAPQVGATAIAWEPGWPAYRIDEGAPILQALSRAARRAFGRDIPASVAGPSNIGNYLATLGVPAISGFGVSCEGIHASNESIELATIEPVYRAYHEALEELLRAQ